MESLKRVLFTALIIQTAPVAEAQLIVPLPPWAQLNGIHTSVPFLTIAPDARSAGMGDLGVASRADAYSQHWNPAKYVFSKKRSGFGGSYTPWLKNRFSGVYHGYLSSYYKINRKNSLRGSFRYFSLGTSTTLTTIGGTVLSQYHPKEFAIDAGYSHMITDKVSGGIVLRYIHSNLVKRIVSPSGQMTKPGTSFAGDLSLYYRYEFKVGEKDALWAFGLNISNVGTPISYTGDAEKVPIPTNLRLGTSFNYYITDHKSMPISADLNKLMVPTPAVYTIDTVTGEPILLRGHAPSESVILGMLRSFYDAPGIARTDGTYSVAVEEFHEHASKGNRKYFTLGLGVRLNPILLDISYLLPTNGQNSPLSNALRITLSSYFGSFPTLPT